MAITYISEPQEVEVSKDVILVKVETDDYITTDGAKAVKRFDMNTSEPGDGDSIRIGSPVMGITWVQFDCVTTPTNPQEFKPRTTETMEEWIDFELIPALESWPFIFLHFDITRTLTSVLITSKEYSAESTITELSSQGWTLNESIDIDGVDRVYLDDYKTRYRIQLSKDFNVGNFIESDWFYLVPNEDQEVTADISDKLDEMFLELNLIQMGSTGFAINNLSHRWAFVEFGDYSGGDPNFKIVNRSNYFHVLKGGRSKKDTDNAFFDDFIDSNKFITNRPFAIIDRDCPDWLHFRRGSSWAVGDLKCMVKLYFDDLTDETVESVTHSGINPKEIWAVATGFKQRNLEAVQPTKTVFKYEVWIEDQITQKTPKFTYYVEDSGIRNTYMIYMNSFGLQESICMIAGSVYSGSFTRDSVTKTGKLFDKHQQRTVPFNKTFKDKLELGSGHIDEELLNAYKDIFITEGVWILGADGDSLYPFELVGGDYIIGSKDLDGNDVHGFKLVLNYLDEVGNSIKESIWR